ncbi:hypothetical protein C8J56DRAFT_953601 [Mycena floridula]|nr:hypothetical protein C8J56DRAFT_953601 [Mycena floridula]
MSSPNKSHRPPPLTCRRVTIAAMKHLETLELLASSSLPTEAERDHINQLIDTSNHEISRLTAIIDKLVLEREALQRNVASYKAILAPIRLLNDDILREIFIHCLPVNRTAATVITEAPLLLGRICRSWRELALSTPALWASIRVDFSHFLDLPRAQQLYQGAQSWLARSGMCPLTIQVLLQVLDSDLRDPTIDFIKFLTTISTRWCSIEIIAPSEWLFSLRSLSETDVPRLEKFSYSASYSQYHSSYHSSREKLSLSLDFLGGEQLRDLGFPNRSYDFAASSSKINFGQLTRLDLQADLVIYADILRRCPNLVTCRMSISCLFPDSTIANALGFEPLTLLHLSSLTIFYHGGEPAIDAVKDSFEKFFSNLNLPHLISFDQNLGMYSLFSWVHHLDRTRSIENLALNLADFGDVSILDYLRTNTSIKWLRIRGWCQPDQLSTAMDGLRYLAPENQNPGDVLCPSLEVLELQSLIISEDVVVPLIRQRAGLVDSDGIAHLKAVHADFNYVDHEVDIQVISQLEDLITSGLSLAISYQSLPALPFAMPASNKCYWPSRQVELEWPM